MDYPSEHCLPAPVWWKWDVVDEKCEQAKPTWINNIDYYVAPSSRIKKSLSTCGNPCVGVLKFQMPDLFLIAEVFERILSFMTDDFLSLRCLAQALDGHCWEAYILFKDTNENLFYRHSGKLFSRCGDGVGRWKLPSRVFPVNGLSVKYFQCRVLDFLRKKYEDGSWMRQHPELRKAKHFTNDNDFAACVFESRCFCVDCFKFLPLHHVAKPNGPNTFPHELNRIMKLGKDYLDEQGYVDLSHKERFFWDRSREHSIMGNDVFDNDHNEALWSGDETYEELVRKSHEANNTSINPLTAEEEERQQIHRKHKSPITSARCYECVNARYPMLDLNNAWGLLVELLQDIPERDFARFTEPMVMQSLGMRKNATTHRFGLSTLLSQMAQKPPALMRGYKDVYDRKGRLPKVNPSTVLEDPAAASTGTFLGITKTGAVISNLRDLVSSVTLGCFYAPKYYGPNLWKDEKGSAVSSYPAWMRLGFIDGLLDRIEGEDEGSRSAKACKTFWFARLLSLLPFKPFTETEIYAKKSRKHLDEDLPIYITLGGRTLDPTSGLSWYRSYMDISTAGRIRGSPSTLARGFPLQYDKRNHAYIETSFTDLVRLRGPQDWNLTINCGLQDHGSQRCTTDFFTVRHPIIDTEICNKCFRRRSQAYPFVNAKVNKMDEDYVHSDMHEVVHMGNGQIGQMVLECDVRWLARTLRNFLEDRETNYTDSAEFFRTVEEEFFRFWLGGAERQRVPISLIGTKDDTYGARSYPQLFTSQCHHEAGGRWAYGDDIRHRIWWGCVGQHDPTSVFPLSAASLPNEKNKREKPWESCRWETISWENYIRLDDTYRVYALGLPPIHDSPERVHLSRLSSSKALMACLEAEDKQDVSPHTPSPSILRKRKQPPGAPTRSSRRRRVFGEETKTYKDLLTLADGWVRKKRKRSGKDDDEGKEKD